MYSTCIFNQFLAFGKSLGKKMEKIVVLATGGTIAGSAASAHDNLRYQAGQQSIEQVLMGVAGLQQALGPCVLEAHQIAQIDSKDLDYALWQTLVQACAQHLQRSDVRGVIVTHGTDTLEETAYFLDQVLPAAPHAATWQDKAVVLVSAMRPATSAQADGPGNLLQALAVVQNPQARGVLAVACGKVQSAQAVRKVQPYHVDAFSSGDQPVLGQVQQGQVQWQQLPAWQPAAAPRLWQQVLHTPAAQWPWVELVHSGAGSTARTVQALQAAGVNGVVLVGTGNATVHQHLLQGWQVPVWRTTRCLEGSLPPQDVLASEWPLAPTGLVPSKARVALLLQLLLA